MSVVSFGICREILLRLPAESLLRFRAVCKRWRAAIDEPCFAKAHINHQQLSSNTIIIRNWVGTPFYPLYYIDLDDLDFADAPQTIPATPLLLTRRKKSLPLSACNGLMLIAPEQEHPDDEGDWEIWNPLTGERLTLPDPSITLQVVAMGLGYDCATDDYRVVVIDYDGVSTRKTHVYSLKSDTWREVGDCPFGFRTQKGVFVNGSLHWLSCDDYIIIAFDFATDKYRQLAMPRLQTTPKSVQLESFGGCLFVNYIGEEYRCDRTHNKHNYFCNDTKWFDAWVMNDYGKVESWIKLCSLKERGSLRFWGNDIRLVAYMKNKKRILVQHKDRFIWFDFESNSTKMVDIHGFSRRDSAISAQLIVGSLLRLHDSCGRDASKIRTMKGRTKIKEVDTKLTFCVRDTKNYEKRVPRVHDNCYSIDSNWFAYSCQGDEIYTASSDPDSDSFIPLDICREIFLHLPAKSLIRFRAVCNAYRAIIDEPFFVRAHTNNQPLANTILIKNSSGPPFYPTYYFDLDALNCTDDLQRMPATPLGFMRSRLSYRSASVCNGLILIADTKWELWNPLTHECLQLPRGEFNSDVSASGIGYDSATDDYKVVCIDLYRPRKDADDESEEHDLEEEIYRTHVYSLRSDSWRMVGNFPVDPDYWQGPDSPGVSVCGALHWTSPWSMDKIIVLDLRTENYSEMQWPPLRRRSSVSDGQRYLDVLGGCLVMFDYIIAHDSEDDFIDVWVMKDYGEEDSWVNAFSINEYKNSFRGNIRMVAFMENESRILLQDDSGLTLYDAESDSTKKMNIHGLTERSYAHAFSGSIFPLHSNCGVNGSGSFTRQRTRIKKKAPMEICDTELYYCVRSRDSQEHCYSKWRYSSSEDEDYY